MASVDCCRKLVRAMETCGPVQRRGQETRAERSFANCRPNVRVMIESDLELGMLRVAEHDAQTAHGG